MRGTTNNAFYIKGHNSNTRGALVNNVIAHYINPKFAYLGRAPLTNQASGGTYSKVWIANNPSSGSPQTTSTITSMQDYRDLVAIFNLNTGYSYWSGLDAYYSSTTWKEEDLVYINNSGKLVTAPLCYYNPTTPVVAGTGIRAIIRLRADVTIDGGNGTANNPYKLVESPIGLYVDYDAGDWTEEDFQLIENSPSEVKPTVNRSKSVPIKQG